MEILDLRLSDQAFQCSSLTQVGIESHAIKFSREFMTGLGFKEILSDFSEKNSTTPAKAKKNDISHCIDPLIRKGALSEVIGPRSLTRESVLYYSTFVTHQAKPYFPTYCELLENMAEETGLRIIIWLEDLVSLPRFDWSLDLAKDAATATKKWFEDRCKGCTVMVSSESGGGKLPIDFIEKSVSRLDFADFLSMLPFHRRELPLINISDVSHCIWNAYVFSRFRGLHLTTTTNKRNHVLYRKLCGKGYSVALIHPIP